MENLLYRTSLAVYIQHAVIGTPLSTYPSIEKSLKYTGSLPIVSIDYVDWSKITNVLVSVYLLTRTKLFCIYKFRSYAFNTSNVTQLFIFIQDFKNYNTFPISITISTEIVLYLYYQRRNVLYIP